jgi:hypothetical protein
MLARVLCVVALIAAASAAKKTLPVSVSQRKVDFEIRTNPEFKKFNKLLTKTFSKTYIQADALGNDMVVVVAPSNAAITRNAKRLKGFYSNVVTATKHVARVEIDAEQGLVAGLGQADIMKMFKFDTPLVSVASANSFDGEFDLLFHRNRFNFFVNDVVVEEVIACTNGYIIVVDAILETPSGAMTGSAFGDLFPEFKGLEGPKIGKFFEVWASNVVFDQRAKTTSKYVEFATDGIFEATNASVVNADRFARRLFSRGDKRMHTIMLAPVNSVMKKFSTKKAIKNLHTNYADFKVFLQHTCFFASELGNTAGFTRQSIYEDVAASPDNKAYCENGLGDKIYFTINPSGKYDGLEVNGIPVIPMNADNFYGKGLYLPIDGIMIPQVKDLKNLWGN